MLQLIFQNFNLIFWIITVSFLLFGLFKYRKNYSESFNSYTLFATIFLYFLYWIPQGFDITDEGFTLSKSWFMLHGMWHENISLTWLSLLLNGIWLSIIGTPSIFWARIAYVLLIALIATYSFKILRFYFDRKEAFISTVVVSSIIAFGFPQTANYQNIPTLFILLSIYYFIKALNTENKHSLIYSGIFIGFGVFARFPVILFIVYPIAYFFIDYLYYKNSIKKIFKLSSYFYVGLFISFLIGIIILLSTNSLSDYYNTIFHRTKHINNATSHSLDTLISSYLTDIWLVISKTFFIIISILIAVFLTRIDKKGFFRIIVAFIFAYIAFYYATNFLDSQNWIYTLFAFGISALILFILISKNVSKKQYTIIFFSLFIFIVSFFGSNNGFRLLIWSGALILPASVFLLLLSNTKLVTDNKIIDFKILQYVFIFFIIFLFIDKYEFSYRDLKKNELTHYFKSSQLLGIKSNERRTEVVDSLLTFTKNNIAKEKSVMYIGTIPTLYYLTNKKYHTKDLWRQPTEEFKNISSKFPDYFVFSLKNPRNYYWPLGKSKGISIKDSLNHDFYLKTAKKSFYTMVYKNTMFVVYKKPKTNIITNLLKKGLVAYYPFNGNAKDNSDNNNNGEIFGAKLTTDRYNNKNSAFYFNGKSYMKIKNDSTLNPFNKITICAWYKPEEYKGSGSDPIVTKGYSAHETPYYQYHLSTTAISYSKENTGKINFTVSLQNKPITLSTPSNYLKKNKWSFIVATFYNDTISIYLDGNLISSKTKKHEGIIKDYKQDLLIGKGNNYEGYIKGTIDEIRIYDRKLSLIEIRTLYNSINLEND